MTARLPIIAAVLVALALGLPGVASAATPAPPYTYLGDDTGTDYVIDQLGSTGGKLTPLSPASVDTGVPIDGSSPTQFAPTMARSADGSEVLVAVSYGKSPQPYGTEVLRFDAGSNGTLTADGSVQIADTFAPSSSGVIDFAGLLTPGPAGTMYYEWIPYVGGSPQLEVLSAPAGGGVSVAQTVGLSGGVGLGGGIQGPPVYDAGTSTLYIAGSDASVHPASAFVAAFAVSGNGAVATSPYTTLTLPPGSDFPSNSGAILSGLAVAPGGATLYADIQSGLYTNQTVDPIAVTASAMTLESGTEYGTGAIFDTNGFISTATGPLGPSLYGLNIATLSPMQASGSAITPGTGVNVDNDCSCYPAQSLSASDDGSVVYVLEDQDNVSAIVPIEVTSGGLSTQTSDTAYPGGPGMETPWHDLVTVGSPPPPGIEISAGNAVPEPAAGHTSPATFTISLPQAQSVDTTVDYKTIDGTATAAADEYTPVTNGSVVIPAGQASAQIQVQVDAGSGVATTSALGFQVQLTGFSGGDSGLKLDPAGDSTFGTIGIPGIGGTVTGPGGSGVHGVTVTLTGTADTGQSVSQTTTTDASGAYQLYADAGTYTVTPSPPQGAGNVTYAPAACPGTGTAGACQNIALGSGANLTATFKQVSLVVNSTATTTDTTQAQMGICDTTPGQATATCTLPQAILVSNDTGGQAIGFDIPGGGTPTINWTESQGPPRITAPATIDGTTQPGSGEVAVMGIPTDLGLVLAAHGITVRGMEIGGFVTDICGGGGSDTIANDKLGTGAGDQSAAIADCSGSGGDVIQGDVIGNASSLSGALHGSRNVVYLTGPDATFGGPQAGSGNTIDDPRDVKFGGAGDVVQGNTFNGSGVELGTQVTFGGAAARPGTGAGNHMNGVGTSPGLTLDGGDVVQGNWIHGEHAGIQVVKPSPIQGEPPAASDGNTIGGNAPDLGNLIESSAYAGIVIGTTWNADWLEAESSNNVIENNDIHSNPSGLGSWPPTGPGAGDFITGGVDVVEGTRNHIFRNRMFGNDPGIAFGNNEGLTADYLYNSLTRGSSNPLASPNNLQPYPELLQVSKHGSTVVIDARLLVGVLHRHTAYTIDIYNDVTRCAQPSITPGQGNAWLGDTKVTTDGTGTAVFSLSLPGAKGSVFTLTATAPDGSTSEFSPCLPRGQVAPSFVKSGVTIPAPITVSPAPGTARDAAAKAKQKPKPERAMLEIFCPPVTTGSCTGTVTLATAHRPPLTVLRRAFKLAPGQLDPITFTVPKGVKLARASRVRITITAHDRAHHTRRTVKVLSVRATDTSTSVDAAEVSSDERGSEVAG
jgi:hypothetical protein